MCQWQILFIFYAFKQIGVIWICVCELCLRTICTVQTSLLMSSGYFPTILLCSLTAMIPVFQAPWPPAARVRLPAGEYIFQTLKPSNWHGRRLGSRFARSFPTSVQLSATSSLYSNASNAVYYLCFVLQARLWSSMDREDTTWWYRLHGDTTEMSRKTIILESRERESRVAPRRTTVITCVTRSRFLRYIHTIFLQCVNFRVQSG